MIWFPPWKLTMITQKKRNNKPFFNTDVCRINSQYPAGNYMFNVSNRKTRTRCEICSKLTIKTQERRLALFWCLYCWLWTFFTPCSSVSVVNLEQVNADWAGRGIFRTLPNNLDGRFCKSIFAKSAFIDNWQDSKYGPAWWLINLEVFRFGAY